MLAKPVYSPGGGGGTTDKDFHYFRQVGTTPLERWYIAGQVNYTNLTTTAYTADTIRAIPFLSGRGGTLDRIGIEVTIAGAGNAKVGIYDSTSDTNLYPNALILDSGNLDISTTGVKSAVISQALTASKLYWFVLLNSISVTVRGLNTGGQGPAIWGLGSSFGSTQGSLLNVSYAFAALPATFPSSTTISAVSWPIIACRYSG